MQQQATSAADSDPTMRGSYQEGSFPPESMHRDGLSNLPERALLVAILKQAYHDATCPPKSNSMRVVSLEAKAFFAEPGRLEWFCSFLNIDPERLRKAAAVKPRKSWRQCKKERLR